MWLSAGINWSEGLSLILGINGSIHGRKRNVGFTLLHYNGLIWPQITAMVAAGVEGRDRPRGARGFNAPRATVEPHRPHET